AFRRTHAELFGLVRAVSRAADYLSRQGGGGRLRRSPHLLCLCAAGADRDPFRGRRMAPLRQARSRDSTDDRRRAGLSPAAKRASQQFAPKMLPGPAPSAFAEHALEDRVDVLEVIAEVEPFFDLGIA